MDSYEELGCIKKELLPGEVMSIEKMESGDCCVMKIYFHALNPGKYIIQATFTYNEGAPIILKTSTVVESKIEAAFNIGIIVIAYTLTRLNLNFKLG
ncbi:MAG: hypothetical protein REH83_03970 [Rickettsiella sp.]|nr:hypothetical protein [Rickettsiella sp.]